MSFDPLSSYQRHLRERRKPIDNTATTKTEGTRRFCPICYNLGQGRLDNNGYCRGCGNTYPPIAAPVEPKQEQRYKTKATTKQPLFAFPLGQKKKARKDGLTDEDLDDISSLLGGYRPEAVNVVDSHEESGAYYY